MKHAAIAVAAFIAAPLLMAAGRPGTELNLLTGLNGEEVRWTMFDGGQSGMYGSGLQCMPVADLPAAANGVVELQPLQPIVLCERSTTRLPVMAADGGVLVPRWDGGCNQIVGDPNFGVQLQPSAPKYVVLRADTTHLCQASDAGTANTAVFAVQ